MVSLLILILLLRIFIYVVNSNRPAFNNILWRVYSSILGTKSQKAVEQKKLRGDVLRLGRELKAVSPQDDFARWAKLNRQHDKAVAELEKLNATLSGSRGSFDRGAGAARWVCTSGARIALQYKYSRMPVYWIPSGWMPGYVERLLSFPRAPKGSVSVMVWGMACASAIDIFSEACVAGYILATREKTQKPVKIAVPAGKAVDEKTEL